MINQNFEQDFKQLVELKEKINLLDKEKEKINLQLQEQSKYFVEKQSIKMLRNRITGLESFLQKGVSSKQILDLVERLDKGEIGLMRCLLVLENHMSGKVLDNELLNYNMDVIRDLEHKFYSLQLDSIEDYESLNNL